MILVNGVEMSVVIPTAKEWVERNSYPYSNCPNIIRKLEQCFSAGFEAGKTVWHQVADGDLPPSLTHVLNEKGNKVMYNDKEHVWQEYSDYYEDYVETKQPIAWCEVPIFEEAETNE